MSYAIQADIELRYPGALDQAGPRNTDGELDTVALGLALGYADAIIEERLSARFPLPWTAPFSTWLVDIACDLALYRATPAVVIDTFKDRKARHDAAVARLDAYAEGKLNPPADPGILEPDEEETVWFSYDEREFGRGTL